GRRQRGRMGLRRLVAAASGRSAVRLHPGARAPRRRGRRGTAPADGAQRRREPRLRRAATGRPRHLRHGSRLPAVHRRLSHRPRPSASDGRPRSMTQTGNGSRWFRIADEPRDWEDFYRERWSFDRSVRSSHSVNCSGSCSWEVFVKDGLICWELQKTDWPQIDSETPNYEPRGCQRGISASWYPYSPVRPKYPYVRGVLL